MRRRKEKVLASGKVWIDPAEQDRIEKISSKEEIEQNRITALKEKCEKKGLDFETENNKYLEKVKEKEEKQKAKAEAKEAKKQAKLAKKQNKKEE